MTYLLLVEIVILVSIQGQFKHYYHCRFEFSSYVPLVDFKNFNFYHLIITFVFTSCVLQLVRVDMTGGFQSLSFALSIILSIKNYNVKQN